MNRIRTLALTIAVAATHTASTTADLLLFDIEADPNGWLDALRAGNKLFKDSFDLGALADFGLEVMDGPLTFEGNTSGSVPFGFLPANVVLDSNLSPFGSGGPNGRGAGGAGLLGVGPSAGFGNPSNAIVSNFAEDSFDLLVTRQFKTAMSFHALSLSGSDTIDITVYDLGGGMLGQFLGLDAPAEGHEYGLILFDTGRYFGHVNIYDSSGGREGILGSAAFYEGDIPAPATLLVLGIGCAGLRAGRRRSE